MIDVHEALLSKFNAVISTSDAHSTTPKAELMEGVTCELAPGLQRYPVLRQVRPRASSCGWHMDMALT